MQEHPQGELDEASIPTGHFKFQVPKGSKAVPHPIQTQMGLLYWLCVFTLGFALLLKCTAGLLPLHFPPQKMLPTQLCLLPTESTQDTVSSKASFPFLMFPQLIHTMGKAVSEPPSKPSSLSHTQTKPFCGSPSSSLCSFAHSPGPNPAPRGAPVGAQPAACQH